MHDKYVILEDGFLYLAKGKRKKDFYTTEDKNDPNILYFHSRIEGANFIRANWKKGHGYSFRVTHIHKKEIEKESYRVVNMVAKRNSETGILELTELGRELYDKMTRAEWH